MTLTDNALNDDVEISSSAVLQLIGVMVLIAMVTLTVVLSVRHVQAADPYIQNVLALNGHVERGEKIFQMNCAVCHGIEANGEVGPSLLSVSARKSKVKLIKQVISGNTPPMPQFQPEAQDMADLLQYLESL